MKQLFSICIKRCYSLIRNSSIFSRLLLSFLFVIILPSLFLINFIYKRVEREFYTTGISYIDQNLYVAVQKSYDRLLFYEQLSQSLCAENQLEKLLEAGERSSVEDALYKMVAHDGIRNLFLISGQEWYRPKNTEGEEKGYALVSPERFRETAAYIDSMQSTHGINWFNTNTEKNMYYGNESQKSYLGNYITMTSCLDVPGDAPVLLVLNIDIQKFSGLANISKLYGQDLFLAAPEGILTNLSNDFSYRNYTGGIWKELGWSEERIHQEKVDGKELLFVTKKLGKEDWYVVSILKKDKMMKVSYDIRNIVITVVLVTTGISLLICAIVTFSISYPLNRFKKAMSLFAKEDFYLEYQDEGKDQIAQVSTIFQGMVKRIGSLAQKQVESQKQISEEQLKRKEMYVSALQMQINPHFLYNMLDIIRWNTVHLESGNGRISRMMSGYSSLLRYNIRLGEGYATIDEEIEYSRKYISLLELLYEKEINLRVETGTVDLTKYRIGKLFFQPVIENTIIHGKLNLLERPWITISICVEDSRLMIHIDNNGRMLEEERIEELNLCFESKMNGQSSIGLMNVNQRIKLLFGEEYGLLIGCREERVRVSMILPALTREGEADVSLIDRG